MSGRHDTLSGARRLILPGILCIAQGCFSVDVATNEPIVIHLKIDQTVRVELEEGVESLIDREARITTRSVDGDASRIAELRAAQIVGESYDGYLRMHTATTPADTARVERINDGRREGYVALAREHRTSVASVELIAGHERVENARAGEVVQRPSGWLEVPER